jgi:hypothetical protein
MRLLLRILSRPTVSMTSVASAMEACANCSRRPLASEPAFKRCSACIAVHYCSVACQRAHWKAHKPHCKASTSTRGPLAVNEGRDNPYYDLTSKIALSAAAQDPTQIFYLRTSQPSIKDISISGPYSNVEDIWTQILHRIWNEKSPEGERALDDAVMGGAIEYTWAVDTVLPDESIMRFEILAETNEEVARAMPTDVYW